MATFTRAERSALSEEMARIGAVVDYDKDTIGAGFQGIENWWEDPATKQALNQAINAATAAAGKPNLSVASKKLMVSVWLNMKAGRERGS